MAVTMLVGDSASYDGHNPTRARQTFIASIRNYTLYLKIYHTIIQVLGVGLMSM